MSDELRMMRCSGMSMMQPSAISSHHASGMRSVDGSLYGGIHRGALRTDTDNAVINMSETCHRVTCDPGRACIRRSAAMHTSMAIARDMCPPIAVTRGSCSTWLPTVMSLCRSPKRRVGIRMNRGERCGCMRVGNAAACGGHNGASA